MGRKRNLALREFFNFDSRKNESICKLCSSVFQGSYSANLTRHLKNKHSATYEEEYIKPLEDNNAEKVKKVKFSVQFSFSAVEDACIKLITGENLPFSFLDSKPFKFLTEQIFSGLNMGHINSRNIISLITGKYNSMKEDIKKLIKNKIISIKIDIATRLDRGILGVNIQFIKKNHICIKTLDMIELHKSHTADDIKTEIEKVFNDYDIDLNQIYTITTDNGRNMLKTVDQLNSNINDDSTNVIDEESDDFYENLTENLNYQNIISIKCSAHTLQLVVKDFLFLPINNKKLIDKSRQIAKTLRTPTYRHSLTHLGLNQVELDVPTCWGSTFKMLKRVLEIREKHNGDLEHIFNELSANEWSEIEKLINALDPVYETTIKLQKNQLFLGDFYKLWTGLKLQLAASENALAKQILEICEKREVSLMENSAIISALYLDPRIRPFLSSTKKEAAKIYLEKLAVQMINLNKKTNEENFASINNQSVLRSSLVNTLIDVRPNQSISSLLRNSLQNIAVSDEDSEDEQQQQTADILTIYREIQSFSPKRIDIDSNIMEFWKDNKHLYPVLSKLAKIVHGVPATQVSVAKCFSALKIVLSDLRYNLTEENLKKILFVKLNDPKS